MRVNRKWFFFGDLIIDCMVRGTFGGKLLEKEEGVKGGGKERGEKEDFIHFFQPTFEYLQSYLEKVDVFFVVFHGRLEGCYVLLQGFYGLFEGFGGQLEGFRFQNVNLSPSFRDAQQQKLLFLLRILFL